MILYNLPNPNFLQLILYNFPNPKKVKSIYIEIDYVFKYLAHTKI